MTIHKDNSKLLLLRIITTKKAIAYNKESNHLLSDLFWACTINTEIMLPQLLGDLQQLWTSHYIHNVVKSKRNPYTCKLQISKDHRNCDHTLVHDCCLSRANKTICKALASRYRKTQDFLISSVEFEETHFQLK